MINYINLATGILLLSASLYWFSLSIRELSAIAKDKNNRSINIAMTTLDEGLFGVRIIAPGLVMFVGACFLLNSFAII